MTSMKVTTEFTSCENSLPFEISQESASSPSGNGQNRSQRQFIYPKLFERVRMYPNESRRIRAYSNASEQFQAGLSKSPNSNNLAKTSKCLRAFSKTSRKGLSVFNGLSVGVSFFFSRKGIATGSCQPVASFWPWSASSIHMGDVTAPRITTTLHSRSIRCGLAKARWV